MTTTAAAAATVAAPAAMAADRAVADREADREAAREAGAPTSTTRFRSEPTHAGAVPPPRRGGEATQRPGRRAEGARHRALVSAPRERVAQKPHHHLARHVRRHEGLAARAGQDEAQATVHHLLVLL